MERKRRIYCLILTLLLGIAGCTLHFDKFKTTVVINFSSGSLQSRAASPDEDKISDVSLLIFDESGSAEECIRLNDGSEGCTVSLVSGKDYTFCACANFGYHIYADHIDELDEIRYHLAYPDEYSSGIPMYAMQKVRIEEGTHKVCLEFERLMSKISLRMDRRGLSEGVTMLVRSVQIGNCPRSASVFTPNRVRNEDDCFPVGFLRGAAEVEPLNRTAESGLSETVSVYMLENMQGKADFESDSDKVFGTDEYRSRVCSYIEMELEYTSELYESSGNGLVYRFYLGDGLNDLNIERNCHYRIIVAPEDDGLNDDGWRVDKSDLTYKGPTSLKAFPASYIVGDIGDKIHIWCELQPSWTPFDVGLEYLEDDKADGIYDYVIDEDGHGAVLTLLGPGTGAVYMEAGPPINDAAVFFIEVNLPK